MQFACFLINGVFRACACKLFMTWKFGIISCHSSVEQMNCSVHHAGDSPFLTLSSDPTLRWAFILKIFLLCFRPFSLPTTSPPTKNVFKSTCAALPQHLAPLLLSIPSPALPGLLHFHSSHHLLRFSLARAHVFLYPLIIRALNIPSV